MVDGTRPTETFLLPQISHSHLTVVSLPLAWTTGRSDETPVEGRNCALVDAVDSAGCRESVAVAAEEGRWKKRVILADEVKNPA